MDLRVRDAAGVIEVDLAVVTLFLEGTADMSDHSHRERPESGLFFIDLSEQRDPRVALISRRLLCHLEAVRHFFTQIILELVFGKSLYTNPKIRPIFVFSEALSSST